MMSNKREGSPLQGDTQSKKVRARKPWKAQWRPSHHAQIQPGESGIWVTCDQGTESRAVREVRDLFEEFAAQLYDDKKIEEADDDTAPNEQDIEAAIASEVNDLQKPQTEPLFTHVRSDIPCVLFFKTRKPVEPVSFVLQLCRDALESGKKRTRHVRRLTPITLVGRATEQGLQEVAKTVLAPFFHYPGHEPQKFAIRPTLRNHAKGLTRDSVIQQVAAIVGQGHKVDLKQYDVLILVEVCKGILGMSVVGKEFEELKRFNIAEIYQPTPRPEKES